MVVRPPGLGRPRAERQREKTREVVVETALRLFVERGYVTVRVEDIAAAAGISRATFYKYFSEREEILAELFARLLDQESVVSPPGDPADAAGRIRTLFVETASRMVANEQLSRFVYRLPIRHATMLEVGARPPLLDAVEDLLAEGVTAGVVRSEPPLPLLAAHVGRTFEAAMRDWAEERVTDAPSHVSTLLDLALHGILVPRKTRTTSVRRLRAASPG